MPMKETEEARIKRIVDMMGQQYTPELQKSLNDDSEESEEMEDSEEETEPTVMPKKKGLFGGIPNISIILGLGKKR